MFTLNVTVCNSDQWDSSQNERKLVIAIFDGWARKKFGVSKDFIEFIDSEQFLVLATRNEY